MRADPQVALKNDNDYATLIAAEHAAADAVMAYLGSRSYTPEGFAALLVAYSEAESKVNERRQGFDDKKRD